jgi:two-component system NtrC family response regulator
LAHAFLQEFASDRRREIEGFSDDAIDLLEMHAWPGNVRELRNVIERAVLFCRGQLVTVEVVSMQTAVVRAEVEAIQTALAVTQGRRADAAELLGISRKTLWEKIKTLEIAVD